LSCRIPSQLEVGDNDRSPQNRKPKSSGGAMMLVNWLRDIDAALAQAKSENKPLLIDFSAAPA
jgi:hypothetical protein